MANNDSDIPTVALDDFIRRFSTRGPRLMWFLGAGASASAGMPTAFDLIWRFKRDLYMSRSQGANQIPADLSQEAVRHRIDAHIASLEGLPPAGDKDEYAALFERAYPSEDDRQAIIDSQMKGGKPSFGHIALAILMRHKVARMVWTTNFDTLIADACAKVFDGTSALTTATLDNPDTAVNAFDGERWPLEVKLHGDFRSRSLKNTPDELRDQDVKLRDLLRSSCARFGLVVVGYSGRDDSIVETLARAVDAPKPFPAGLFWLRRDGEPRFPAVAELLRKGAKKGVEAAFVEVNSFDETLRGITQFTEDIDRKTLEAYAPKQERWTAAPIVPKPSRPKWPVVRFNALPVVSTPTNCRVVECEIGGTQEVRDAVESAAVDVVAARSRNGVLAFGADADVRGAFERFSITGFDLHTLQPWKSAERGLMNDAIRRALGNHRGLASSSTDKRTLFPENPNEPVWAGLRALVGKLSGCVGNNAGLLWREGVRVHLDFADGEHWLLFDPCTLFEGITEDNRAICADFARERTVKRYNRQLNELIDFWAKHLAQEGDELRTIGTGSGVDAVFKLSHNTAFSRRSS